jgi:hypothetical protein
MRAEAEGQRGRNERKPALSTVRSTLNLLANQQQLCHLRRACSQRLLHATTCKWSGVVAAWGERWLRAGEVVT